MPELQPPSADLAEALRWMVAHCQASTDELTPGALELAEVLWLAWQLPEQPSFKKALRQERPAVPPDVDSGLAKPPAQRVAPKDEMRPTGTVQPPDPFQPTPFPEHTAQRSLDDPLLPVAVLPDERDVARDLAGTVLRGRVQEEAPLGDRGKLLRALAPLWRRRPDPHRQRFDEERTVELFAQCGLLLPVLLPSQGPVFDEVLLLRDGGVSMQVWQRQAEELQRVLASTQVFPRVRLQELEPGPMERSQDPEVHQQAVEQLSGTAQFLQGSRTLLLVLSDTAGRHWWDGRMFGVLRRWGRVCPTAILQPLPIWHWSRTALAAVERVSVRNSTAAAANPAYGAGRLHWWDEPLPAGRELPLPVLPLDRQALGTWGAMVMGNPAYATAGVALPPQHLLLQRLRQVLGDRDLSAPTQAPEPLTAEAAAARWEAFQAMASPQAQQLLLVMASSPLLTLPVIGLLKMAKLPQAIGSLPIAEVLTSGLLVRRQDRRRKDGELQADSAQPLRPEQIQFEVVPEVAELLRHQLPAMERRDVISRVSALVERRWNRQIGEPSFEAMLCDPTVAPPKGMEGVVQFAAVTASLLDTLPGEAARAFAERIRKGSRLPPGSPWPASLKFKPLAFETAAVVDVPQTELVSITAAWFVQLELQQITFFTVRVSSRLSPGRAVASSVTPQMVLMEPSAAAAVTALIVLPDGRLVSGAADGSIRLWDHASGSVSAVLWGHRDVVFALVLLPDGRLASGSGDRTIRLWDLASGSCLAVIEEHVAGVTALAVLPDGRLASGSRDSTIQVRETAGGFCSSAVLGGSSGVNALAVLPDGRLAFGFGDGTIRFWDSAAGLAEAVLRGHQGGVNTLVVLSDDHLASGSEDHTIRLWNASSGACTAVYQGHQGGITALLMLANGLLASASRDGSIRIWNLASGDCQQILEGKKGPVQALGLLAAGRLIASAEDGRILVWEPIVVPLPRPDLVVGLASQEATAWAFHEPLQRDQLPFGAAVDRPDPLALTLVEIQAGSFLMGSPKDEPERHSDEGPQHQVAIQEFFMAQTPITQAQWRQVAGWQEREAERWGRELNPTPSQFSDQPDSDNRPVDNVSWLDAMEFCHRLSQRTGRYYTLPSEAQWEYACRAGTTTPFAFGATLSAELANYDATYTYADGPKGEYREQTTPVGMFPANAWGLHDMHGNVWEWCLDHWHDSYEGAPSDGSAWLMPSASEEEPRLLRGGSWLDDPWYCRSAFRDRGRPGFANVYVGFRVVCLPQGPSLNA